MERINLRVRPEDLRYVAITCRCSNKSTAEIPEQMAKAFNAHICPSCGTMYRITLSVDGNVTGKDGRKWLVKRGPSVGDVASMDEANVAEALENLGQEKVSIDHTDCHFCNGKGYLAAREFSCTHCKGTGKEQIN